ncbi:MAG TPA: cytochrome c [Burkholderiales bacterium]|nr:cytochrome c [Burkholderiales bacterium]
MKPFMTCALAIAGAVHFTPAAAQDPNAGRNLSAACFTCHGTGGNSVGGVPPGLAGRDSAELFQTMKDFQSGKRPATIMHQQARGYTDEQLKLIAAYIATLKPAAARTPPKAN